MREAGYDACFNHRTERDYGAVLDKLCPKGIDSDFDDSRDQYCLIAVPKGGATQA